MGAHKKQPNVHRLTLLPPQARHCARTLKLGRQQGQTAAPRCLATAALAATPSRALCRSNRSTAGPAHAQLEVGGSRGGAQALRRLAVRLEPPRIGGAEVRQAQDDTDAVHSLLDKAQSQGLARIDDLAGPSESGRDRPPLPGPRSQAKLHPQVERTNHASRETKAHGSRTQSSSTSTTA